MTRIRERGAEAKAPLLLLLAAAIWGFAFVAQRTSMEHIGPFLFTGIRFLLGSLALAPLLWRRRRVAFTRGGAPTGPLLLAGVVLFAAASLQQIGLVYTTAGKGGIHQRVVRGDRPASRPVARASCASLGLGRSDSRGRGNVPPERDGARDHCAGRWACPSRSRGLGGARSHRRMARRAGRSDPHCSHSVRDLWRPQSVGRPLYRDDVAPRDSWERLGRSPTAVSSRSAWLTHCRSSANEPSTRRAPGSCLVSRRSAPSLAGGFCSARPLSPRALVGCALMLAGMVLAQLRHRKTERAFP